MTTETLITILTAITAVTTALFGAFAFGLAVVIFGASNGLL